MKKAIKKIVALGMGISMLGAAVAAADLNDYPAPFIQGGKFSGTLVVGDNAAAEDVVGVSDVAMSLQYAASVKAGTGSGATTTVEGDAYRVEESGDSLNLFQPLSGVTSVLSDTDLNALADGTFKAKTTVGYTQTWTMPGTAEVQWVVDNDASIEDPQLYLYVPQTDKVIDYQLSFTTQPESDYDGTQFEDWEDQVISILGKEYTITKAENQTAAPSTGFKLTMMAGAVQDTLEVGQTKTYTINGKDYEVTVMVVSGDTSSTAVTKLIVNDEVTKSLSKDETYTLKDGIDVGIKEVLPTKSGDVVQNLVEFYLGAEKLVLDGKNQKMEIGEESISDVTVTFSGSKTATVGKISTIDIEFTPSDDYYVPVGGKLSEAMVDNSDYSAFMTKLGIDYQFEGLDASPMETVKFFPKSDDTYKIEFTNRDGTTYSHDIFWIGNSQTNANAYLGEDANDGMAVREDQKICDNDYFVVENNKISRILQLRDVSTSEETVEIKDMGTGDSTEYSYKLENGENVSTIPMDGANYKLNVTDPDGKCVLLDEITDDTTSNRAALWTQFDVEINLYNWSDIGNATGNDVLNGYFINITEDEDGKEDNDVADKFAFNFSYDSSDGLALDTSAFVGMDSADASTTMLDLDSDDNAKEGYTQWGNKLMQTNTDNQDKWTLEISKKEAVAKVFMTAGTTQIATTDVASGDTVILNKIDVGATKLASEVAGTETTTNLILVGGPCANAAVEAASDEFPTCNAWPLDPGEALIQMVEQDSGSVALLVAGTLAEDTRAATGLVSEQTKLQALADGVTKQKVTVSTGTLVDMPAAVVESSTDDAVGTDDTMVDSGNEEIDEELNDQ